MERCMGCPFVTKGDHCKHLQKILNMTDFTDPCTKKYEFICPETTPNPTAIASPRVIIDRNCAKYGDIAEAAEAILDVLF